MDLLELAAELNHLRKLKRTSTRRLWVRQQQKAAKGTDCPPDIVMEIEDIEIVLEGLDKEIVRKERLIQEMEAQISETIGEITQLAQEPIDKIMGKLVELRDSIDVIIKKLEDRNNTDSGA